MTVFVLTLILVNASSGSGSIHDVDAGPPSTRPEDRPTLADAFQTWVTDPRVCDVTVGGRKVRPMLLVAAEGGGIRATYWTVRGLEALDFDSCAGRSALFSAGASGGSVGLTVARFSGTDGDPGLTRAVGAVQAMSDQSTLSTAADGMFIRDNFFGATGVPLPQLGSGGPAWDWADRARLIESGWKASYMAGGAPWGTRSYLTDRDLSPATGALILNSTSVKNTCRVWVSQLSLPEVAPAPDVATRDPEDTCDKVPGPGARTIDLFGAYGPYADDAPQVDPEPNRQRCLGNISAATAALLTARFPYVTPGAVIGPCPDRGIVTEATDPYWPSTQLVDGGYIEDSGLATITDLAPDWLPLVRQHNLAAADPASGLPLVVPFMVYLSNGDSDTVHPALNQGPASDVALPVTTLAKGGKALSGPNALLERAQQAVGVGSFCAPQTSSADDARTARLERACAALDVAFPRRVIVVDRLPRPEISAPLGWALSQSSRLTLNAAVDYQVKARCGEPTSPPTCRLGYAPLGELRHYFGAG